MTDEQAEAIKDKLKAYNETHREPFANKHAFDEVYRATMTSLLTGKPVSRSTMGRLLASHYWDTFAQRQEFTRRVFPFLHQSDSEQQGESMSTDNYQGMHRQPRDVLGDMLAQQYEHMQDYQKKYYANGYAVLPEESYGQINNKETQDTIRMTNLWLIEELMEAQNLLKAKPWKMSSVATDIDAYHKEIGDSIHFFLELLILSGLDTAEKVWAVYSERSINNTARRATDY